ncbi:MAG TPA: zf-HC2 domain-containing protein [Pyrinomonadaceae bacterium]|nr:zf-HC2 domain-containing protein [Pyrinomonadaceae bacterium]
MKCTRIEKFLPLYVAGDLAVRRTRAIGNHLATCEKCRLNALEYQASRDMFCAATLAPDFEGAFYEEIRDSVLAQIKRERMLAPPSAFAKLFNPRLAYAASLILFLIAALALQGSLRRTPDGGGRDEIIAAVNAERPTTPAAIKTAQASRQESNTRLLPPPFKASTRSATGKRHRAAIRAPGAARAEMARGRNEVRPNSSTAQYATLTAGQNPPATSDEATKRANAVEINAASVNESEPRAQLEVSRIEIQTSDPNIRIIWLSPVADNAPHLLK